MWTYNYANIFNSKNKTTYNLAQGWQLEDTNSLPPPFSLHIEDTGSMITSQEVMSHHSSFLSFSLQPLHAKPSFFPYPQTYVFIPDSALCSSFSLCFEYLHFIYFSSLVPFTSCHKPFPGHFT